MKAIVRTTYGSSDVLELRDIEVPSPKDNQVLVKVLAAAINPLDWHVLRGKPFLVRLAGFGLFKPKHPILGADMAGRVEAVGAHVTQFKIGDEVFGSALGSFADYACFAERKLAPKPTNLTFEQAAAIPVAGLTALQALRDYGQLQPGHHVLIIGASGGVGTFAVQIAKAMEARVTAVCSGRNVELARSIGADDVIDYTREDYAGSGRTFDVIIDTVGAGSVRKPFRTLTPTGTYVGVGGSGSILETLVLKALLSRKAGRKITVMLTKIVQADLLLLKDLLESGKITPVIDRTYPFREIPQAIRYLEQGHARGKVVITVSGT